MNAQRHDQRYDEKRPPQGIVEKAIMDVLAKKDFCSPRELISSLKTQGFSGPVIKVYLWALIERGYIELTPDRKLKGAR